MIAFKVRANFDRKKVEKKMAETTFKSLGHVGASIRKDVRQNIRRRKDRKKVSPVGTPPFTHTGRLKKAILYDVNKRQKRVVIGPAKHLFGTAGRAHEFGGLYKGQYFRPRPFMRPALKRAIPRLPKFWKGVLRG